MPFFCTLRTARSSARSFTSAIVTSSAGKRASAITVIAPQPQPISSTRPCSSGRLLQRISLPGSICCLENTPASVSKASVLPINTLVKCLSSCSLVGLLV